MSSLIAHRRRTLAALISAAAVATPVVAAASGLAPVAGAAEPQDVVINEVESNGDSVADWVELANTNDIETVDVSGWSILDGKDSHEPIVLPEGATIESGGYLAIYTEEGKTPEGNAGGFGLGDDDSVRLFDAEDDKVDETTWSGHAKTTWGRVPDKTGDFTVTGEPTRGLANVAAGEQESIANEAWPFDPQDVVAQEVAGEGADAFSGEDMSGIDVDADGTVWVVNNDKGTLFALRNEGENAWSVAGQWQLRYADGAGEPDAEGVTVGGDGALYIATERNNEDKKESRPAVLRFEKPALDSATENAELNATGEWNLADAVGEIGANAGLEAIEYLPEAWGGAFAVGVEATGEVLFVQLDDANTATLQQRYQSPFAGVMALDFDEQAGELRALCDEECDGASIVLANGDEGFAPVTDVQARPEAMGNFANEGFATIPAEQGAQLLWADDGVTDGVSLRGAVVTDTDTEAEDAGENAGKETGEEAGGEAEKEPAVPAGATSQSASLSSQLSANLF